MPLLEVSDLTVRFGGILALDKISFQVDYGETLAIVGPNGCGKTTLLNALSGFVEASGSIRIEGQEIASKPAWWRARRCFGRTMQVPRCFESLTLKENLGLASWATKLMASTNPLTRASQVLLSCFEPLLAPAQPHPPSSDWRKLLKCNCVACLKTEKLSWQCLMNHSLVRVSYVGTGF